MRRMKTVVLLGLGAAMVAGVIYSVATLAAWKVAPTRWSVVVVAPGGAPVPGAAVSIEELATGRAAACEANDHGLCVFGVRALPIRVDVKALGYEPAWAIKAGDLENGYVFVLRTPAPKAVGLVQ